MKHNVTITVVAIAILAAITFAGCSLLGGGMSPEQRIARFSSDLKNIEFSAYLNLYDRSERDAYQDPTAFAGPLDTDDHVSLSISGETDIGGGRLRFNVSAEALGLWSGTVDFQEDSPGSGNWMIYQFNFTSPSTYNCPL